VNQEYLKRGQLTVSVFNRGTAWLDTGTFASLMQAGQFVQVIEERQGFKVGCIEEIAFRMGFIDSDQLVKIAMPLVKSGYGKYLMSLK
jgi:glucose-1-phosphate thymidylyltransferase